MKGELERQLDRVVLHCGDCSREVHWVQAEGHTKDDRHPDQAVRTIGPPCRREVQFVLFALVHLLLRRVVLFVAGSSNDQMTTEVEVVVVVLRHQLNVLKRQAGRPRLRRRDRLFMAALSRVLPRARWSSFLVSPQTLLRWHRELVRRKWTFRRRSTGGRPSITDHVRDLILQMGRENPRWGCIRIRGELAKLGIRVSATKIRTVLPRPGSSTRRPELEPVPAVPGRRLRMGHPAGS